MINGRAKGHAFERELIKLFQDEFGECADHLKRNLDQYQIAGKADIEFNNIMIEAKRYAKGSWFKPEWWQQTLTSAGDTHVPLLIYKYDRQPMRFVFRISDIMGDEHQNATATVDCATGIMLMREMLEFSNA
ncbi:MAG: hypothetical protein OSA04_07490 [Flavobacteriales bacterium]|nr:hypothetical protein [Flavobacteriales bacterium]